MNRDYRIVNVLALDLVAKDVLEELRPRPVEGTQAVGAGGTQRGEARFNLLDAVGGLFTLETEIIEELLVLLLQPGAELQAVARVIFVIADDNVIQRRQR